MNLAFSLKNLRLKDYREISSAAYAEKQDRRVALVDKYLSNFGSGLVARLRRKTNTEQSFILAVRRHETEFKELSNEDLRKRAQNLRPQLLDGTFSDEATSEIFALVVEATSRVLGFRHRDVQIFGGILLLRGRLLEMATGEGKTVTAVLAAAAAAFAGLKVHVITVNDYLAKRDFDELSPIYQMLGLTTGLVLEDDEQPGRQTAYRQNIVYVNNKSVTFDYLRDRLSLGQKNTRSRLRVSRAFGNPFSTRSETPLVLDGLQFAIIDEADSVLIDEAKTPLIISSESPDPEDQELYRTSLETAAGLTSGEDYIYHERDRQIDLTKAGEERIRSLTGGPEGLWQIERARNAMVNQALQALHCFENGVHYLIVEGKIQIVDEFTGRVMEDRSWEGGLNQLIETHEGLELTRKREVIGRITYQSFFRRYQHLCGMTGTAMEVSGEVATEYSMAVRSVPTDSKIRRWNEGTSIFRTESEKWGKVTTRIIQVAKLQRRPVLVGLRTVSGAENLSAALKASGVPHAVLSAKQDAGEAEIVAEAGRPGRVTVATNMAGRGTDIKVDDSLDEKGGLHVILTEYHESVRIDRQLIGRTARQGNNGTFETIVSLEDELFERFAKRPRDFLLAVSKIVPGESLPTFFATVLRKVSQYRAERLNASIRFHHVKSDQQMRDAMSFSGKAE